MRVLRVLGVAGLCVFFAVMGVGGYLHWWPWYVAGFWGDVAILAMYFGKKLVDRRRDRTLANAERAE